jgi:transposase
MSDVVEEIIYRRCCGLDIHKEMIMACMIIGKKKEVRTFNTMTDGLLLLSKWLKDNAIQMVAMESTGSYWKPIFNILECEEIPAILVNANETKSLRGRKTDVNDAEWIASLLRHGLLKASFVPNREMRELRELVKYRTSLTEDSTRTQNRIEKILQGANIKLSSVISKTGTKTELSIIEALANGVSDIETLVELAQGSLKNKKAELKCALNGLIGEHQRLLLKSMHNHLKQIYEEISVIEVEIEKRMAKDTEIIERLDEIPGVGKTTAQVILSEIGTNMKQFLSENHLASWAGVCPGQNESAGKRKSGKTRKGNSHLKKALVQCANSASLTKNTYLSAQYKRISARRGRKRAKVALAHTILIICYILIKEGVKYKELGGNFFDKRNEEAIVKRNVKRLEALGYEVQVKRKAS